MEKIIKLAPSYKDYLWGGTKLREDYGKSSTCEKVAESWEISCHPDGLRCVQGSRHLQRPLPACIRIRKLPLQRQMHRRARMEASPPNVRIVISL